MSDALEFTNIILTGTSKLSCGEITVDAKKLFNEGLCFAKDLEDEKEYCVTYPHCIEDVGIGVSFVINSTAYVGTVATLTDTYQTIATTPSLPSGASLEINTSSIRICADSISNLSFLVSPTFIGFNVIDTASENNFISTTSTEPRRLVEDQKVYAKNGDGDFVLIEKESLLVDVAASITQCSKLQRKACGVKYTAIRTSTSNEFLGDSVDIYFNSNGAADISPPTSTVTKQYKFFGGAGTVGDLVRILSEYGIRIISDGRLLTASDPSTTLAIDCELCFIQTPKNIDAFFGLAFKTGGSVDTLIKPTTNPFTNPNEYILTMSPICESINCIRN